MTNRIKQRVGWGGLVLGLVLAFVGVGCSPSRVVQEEDRIVPRKSHERVEEGAVEDASTPRDEPIEEASREKAPQVRLELRQVARAGLEIFLSFGGRKAAVVAHQLVDPMTLAAVVTFSSGAQIIAAVAASSGALALVRYQQQITLYRVDGTPPEGGLPTFNLVSRKFSVEKLCE